MRQNERVGRSTVLGTVENGDNDKRRGFVLELVDDDIGRTGDQTLESVGCPASWSHVREGFEAVDGV